MFSRCADVSVTLLAVTDAACELSSILGAQPLNDMTLADAMSATTTVHGNLRRRCAVARPPIDLVFIFALAQVRAVPPPAAKRLKQCRRVGKTISLGLHQADQVLLISLLSA